MFGWTPDGKDKTSSSGSVIFHDAWPTTWPKLTTDILNNHHAKYYQANKGKDDENPPGDWESPVPVYFLAIPAGTEFGFTVKGRSDDTDARLVELAKSWLLGGLVHLGAGAKTACGYGYFAEVQDAPTRDDLKTSGRAVFECTLELTSPAFLAGANQGAEDCDLRSATLRGQLRWWWRTMHAGHLTVDQLRALEAAIWGNTQQAGAVTTVVERLGLPAPIPGPFKELKEGKPQFSELFRKHHNIPQAPPRGTQGLAYAAYGMDEWSQGQRKQRHCVEPGSNAQWTLRLVIRPARIPEDWFAKGQPASPREIPAAIVLEQALAALWLLCRFGGVGSKCRKGFGSFAEPSQLSSWTLDKCKSAGKTTREQAGLRNQKVRSETPTLEEMLPPVEVNTPWRDSWFALKHPSRQTLRRKGCAWTAPANSRAAKATLESPKSEHMAAARAASQPAARREEKGRPIRRPGLAARGTRDGWHVDSACRGLSNGGFAGPADQPPGPDAVPRAP